MNFNFANLNVKNIKDFASWRLLFLLLFLVDVKLAIKVPAIIIIYLLQFNFNLGFRLKNSRLPLFYIIIIAIACINFALNINNLNPSYLFVFFNGIVFWILCILIIHQIKLIVDGTDTQKIHNTILIFFIINTAFSFFTMAHIIWETKSINPFLYQGNYQKYFISTGDYIKGVSFDTSTTNAVLNAIGLIYFLVTRKPLMVIACMVVLLLTGSNYLNIMVLLLFVYLFIFKSDKDQKSIMVVCITLLIIFMGKVSPQNNVYAAETLKNIIHPQVRPLKKNTSATTKHVLTTAEIKQNYAQHYIDSLSTVYSKYHINKTLLSLPATIAKSSTGRIIIPGPDINTKPYQTPTNTTHEMQVLKNFIAYNKAELPISGTNKILNHLPGKVLAMEQTLNFLIEHPSKIFFGTGMGDFSSKLAFRATGLGFSGTYPAKHVYLNSAFLANHLDLYLYFFSKNAGQHSLTNSPYNVYDQLLSEYGLLGLMAFFIFYLLFFAKHYKQLTYGLPILLLLVPVLFIDYWFEQLSIIIFFELLLILDIKETTNKVMASA